MHNILVHLAQSTLDLDVFLLANKNPTDVYNNNNNKNLMAV